MLATFTFSQEALICDHSYEGMLPPFQASAPSTLPIHNVTPLNLLQSSIEGACIHTHICHLLMKLSLLRPCDKDDLEDELCD